MSELKEFKISLPEKRYDVEVSLGKQHFCPRTIFITFTDHPPENIVQRLLSISAENGWIAHAKEFETSKELSAEEYRKRSHGNWFHYYDMYIECIGYYSWYIAEDICRFLESNGLRCAKVQLMIGKSENETPTVHEVERFRHIDSGLNEQVGTVKEFRLC